MADFTEVADALRDIIAAAVYPAGTGSASAVGFDVQVYQGWPLPEKLDLDLKAGHGHVSVWPTSTERPGVDHFPEWQTLSIATATISSEVVANVVTLAGTVTPGQAAALIADGKAFAYLAGAGDPLADVAAALATGMTAAGVPSAAVGAVITLTGAKHVFFRSGGIGTSIRELRRQERVFQIGCWAKDHTMRDTLAKAVDGALSSNWRVSLPDGSACNVRYMGASQHDEDQKQLVYRRDLMFAAEYATTQTRTDAQVLIETTNVQIASVIATAVPVVTTNF